MDKVPSLRPARPEAHEGRPAYLPRFPWRWVALGATIITVVAGGHWLKERRKASALQEQILRVHQVELAEVRSEYAKLRDKLERWTAEASAKKPDNYVDPRLQLAKLGHGQGLYLRLPRALARNTEQLREAASMMVPDAIPRCLGLAPSSARGLYERGFFLDDAWIEEARQSHDVRRLRVIDDELARRIQRDLPSVMSLTRKDWFMLVLQHEKERAAGPVDVFLWHIPSGESLLRARVESRGLLLPARVESANAPYSPKIERRVHASGADDCSIAAQVKALTGERPLEVNALPTVAEATPEPPPQD